MRITPDELDCLVSVLSKFIHESAELRLFGSRVDNSAKGGDFDLLLIVEGKESKENLQYHKPDILSQIKAKMGEQKIDLIITRKDQIGDDPFVSIVFPESVLLKKW